ncbi:MAG: YraN family protein [Candidatus Omnitrophica bacterium]|nr:YraN family protein [Candidatus Omnitrophota bacterium]
MGSGNRIVGETGEKAAVKFLKAKGYRIIATNFRTIFGELDVVARCGKTLVFAEVKTRTTDSLGPPYLAVTWLKQRHIIKNALFYMKTRGMLDSNWRIDVVSVKLGLDLAVENIELIENAVEDRRY